MSKLSEIQAKLKAPKNQFNKFGGYKYRSCEDILEAVKPLLNGATITIEDEIILIGDRYYVKATATFRDGEEIQKVSAFAREPLNKKGMDESQITGAASSYSRKYALNGLLLIDDNKDADATNQHGKAPAPQKKVTPLDKLRQLIGKYTNGFQDKEKMSDICTKLDVSDLGQLKNKDELTILEMVEYMKGIAK